MGYEIMLYQKILFQTDTKHITVWPLIIETPVEEQCNILSLTS